MRHAAGTGAGAAAADCSCVDFLSMGTSSAQSASAFGHPGIASSGCKLDNAKPTFSAYDDVSSILAISFGFCGFVSDGRSLAIGAMDIDTSRSHLFES